MLNTFQSRSVEVGTDHILTEQNWELKVEDQFEYILTQMNVNPVKLDENVVWVGLDHHLIQAKLCSTK
jgi:hypothetical protein